MATEREIEEKIFEEFGLTPVENLKYIVKDGTIEVRISHYNTLDERNGKEFLGFAFESKDKQSGCSLPCDTYEELFRHIAKHIGQFQASLF